MKSKNEILAFIIENKSLLSSRFHITKIGLFGSFARDEQKEHSDLDLIVEFEENTLNLYDLKQQIREFFRNSLDVDVDICREKYLKPTFKNSILKETIYVE